MRQYTAVIVGGGPAGHTCAVRIAQLGGKVAVVERDYLGGVCTNWGCTPSKAMIEAAKIARTVKESAEYGIYHSDFAIDFGRVAARRDEVIRKARQEVTHLLRHHAIDIYQGEAEVIGPGRVKVHGGKLDPDGTVMHYDGQEEVLAADNIVLATGSQPLLPEFVNADDPTIVSSNRLIGIRTLPKSLTIVGGGVIGLEFATIFSNLGSRVTVIEFLDRVLATLDPEVSAETTRHLVANDVRVLTSHKVLMVESGAVVAENRVTGEVCTIASEAVLIATGRKAVINEEMFARLGIDYTEKGISIDDSMQTNVPGIWAIGDATGKSILAHVGMQQGVICAENMMRKPSEPERRMDYSVIPAVVYTIPEVVAVGSVPADLNGVAVFTVPFSANLRARVEGHEEGFVKVWIRDNRVCAVQAVGHHVSEIVQELANMIALQTPIHEVAEIVHAHPTYSEITRSTLEYALGKAVDFYTESLARVA